MNLSLVIDVVDRITAPIRRIGRAIARLGRVPAVQRLSERFTQLRRSIGGVAGQIRSMLGTLGVAGGAGLIGGVGLFTRSMVNANAQMERFETMFSVLEGGAERGRASLDWVNDFARTTPFTLDQVTEAFMRLRAAGVDPTDGSLRDVGDAAAARGEDILQVAEAIADAVTMEYERLKELGITASVAGESVTFAYETLMGRRVAIAQRNNPQMIAAVLTGIWNEQYAGAMEELSRTWQGVVSNLQDAWFRFNLAVGQAGIFERLKAGLEELLTTVNRMAENGELAALAQRISDAMVRIYQAFRSGLAELPALFDRVREAAGRVAAFLRPVTDRFGALETAIGAVVLIMGAPLLMAIASVAQALTLLAAHPVVAGILAIGGLIGWLVTRFVQSGVTLEGVLNGIGRFFDERVVQPYRAAMEGLALLFDRLVLRPFRIGWLELQVTWLEGITTITSQLRRLASLPGADFIGLDGLRELDLEQNRRLEVARQDLVLARDGGASASAGRVAVDTGGELVIRVEAERGLGARVTEGRLNSGARILPDTGLILDGVP